MFNEGTEFKKYTKKADLDSTFKNKSITKIEKIIMMGNSGGGKIISVKRLDW